MTQRVAKRYAAALAETTAGPTSPVTAEAALGQLRAFAEAFSSSRELRNVLASPAVPPVQKRALVGALADRLGLSETVRNFVHVVIDHRRLAVFEEIVEAFEDKVDEASGLTRIEVASASPLDETQKQQFVARFGRMAGKQVRARFDVDRDLLGGSLVRIGSNLFDGSLRAQLRALDRSLAGQA